MSENISTPNSSIKNVNDMNPQKYFVNMYKNIINIH